MANAHAAVSAAPWRASPAAKCPLPQGADGGALANECCLLRCTPSLVTLSRCPESLLCQLISGANHSPQFGCTAKFTAVQRRRGFSSTVAREKNWVAAAAAELIRISGTISQVNP